MESLALNTSSGYCSWPGGFVPRLKRGSKNIIQGKLDGGLVEIRVRLCTPFTIVYSTRRTRIQYAQISSSVLSVLRLHCTPLLFSTIACTITTLHSAPLIIFPAR